MTQVEYQNTYYSELNKFLVTPCGQHFLSTLGTMRPGYEFPQQPHLLHENRGAMRGYELCLRNALILSKPPAVHHEVQPTYGVPNRAPDPK